MVFGFYFETVRGPILHNDIDDVNISSDNISLDEVCQQAFTETNIDFINVDQVPRNITVLHNNNGLLTAHIHFLM